MRPASSFCCQGSHDANLCCCPSFADGPVSFHFHLADVRRRHGAVDRQRRRCRQRYVQRGRYQCAQATRPGRGAWRLHSRADAANLRSCLVRDARRHGAHRRQQRRGGADACHRAEPVARQVCVCTRPGRALFVCVVQRFAAAQPGADAARGAAGPVPQRRAGQRDRAKDLFGRLSGRIRRRRDRSAIDGDPRQAVPVVDRGWRRQQRQHRRKRPDLLRFRR